MLFKHPGSLSKLSTDCERSSHSDWSGTIFIVYPFTPLPSLKDNTPVGVLHKVI